MARQFQINDKIRIPIGLDRVFALSTSVPLVARSLKMRPVAGETTGAIKLGSRVLWKGWKFLLPQRHESLITGFESPHVTTGIRRVAYFQDTQKSGRFASFQHDHKFQSYDGSDTLIEDEIRFTMKWGWLGTVLGFMVLQPYIRAVLRDRLLLIDTLSKSEEGDQYIHG